MIIIVEGPDGAGKTTLVNKLLASHPNSVCKHFGKPESNEAALVYWKVYALAVLNTNKDVLTIFDRSWYTDMVYGPILRHRLEMEALYVKMLEALVLTNGGGYVIHCTAPTKLLWSRCKARGEELITSVDMLDDISNAYEYVFANKCGLPVVRYDTRPTKIPTDFTW